MLRHLVIYFLMRGFCNLQALLDHVQCHDIDDACLVGVFGIGELLIELAKSICVLDVSVDLVAVNGVEEIEISAVSGDGGF